MKIVFFGTPQFSAEILKDLISKKVEVCAVVTQPDKTQGRHLKLTSCPVKKAAQTWIPNTPILQPKKVSSADFLETIKEFKVDFFVVVAFGQIFPQVLLDMPPSGCINVHTSLLPKYRGAAPIQRAIIEGEVETGVSIMYMVKACDAGDVLNVKTVPIPKDMNAGELTIELCKASQEVLFPTLEKVLSNELVAKKQDPKHVTFAKKVTPDTAHITWSSSSKDIYNLFRGVMPKPGAWCWVYIRGKQMRLKILEMELSSKSGNPGEVLQYDGLGIVLGCLEGSVSLKTVQLEGKKALKSSDFVKGYHSSIVSFSSLEN